MGIKRNKGNKNPFRYENGNQKSLDFLSDF